MSDQPTWGGPRDDTGPPPERPAGEPVRDLHPTMDARFVLVEVGKLMNQSEANTKALDKLSDKISGLDGTVKNTLLIGKVLIAVLVVLGGGIWWLASALWPLRDQLLAIITGPR